MKNAVMGGMPKYSLVEIERRWLVDLAAVEDLSPLLYRDIEDLYVAGSRLRLRKVLDARGVATFKLGKKYGKHTTVSEASTNLYLTEGEYHRLSSLPGISTRKRRYSVANGALDVYQRSGLAVFEIEFDDEASAQAYQPPSFVAREITGDSTFSGISLADSHAT